LKEETYFNLAERMAFRALGSTYPNPPVGAIIVKNGIILSRGWTQRSGSFHAEVHAINQIRNKRILNGATLYSTLEPCYHKGKNPPCVDKIIKYKFLKS
jgi:Pyrimidine deaminase